MYTVTSIEAESNVGYRLGEFDTLVDLTTALDGIIDNYGSVAVSRRES